MHIEICETLYRVRSITSVCILSVLLFLLIPKFLVTKGIMGGASMPIVETFDGTGNSSRGIEAYPPSTAEVAGCTASSRSIR